jgi:hypothetical protein
MTNVKPTPFVLEALLSASISQPTLPTSESKVPIPADSTILHKFYRQSTWSFKVVIGIP